MTFQFGVCYYLWEYQEADFVKLFQVFKLVQKRHKYKWVAFRFTHRKLMILQENWHKAHQISKNFGLTWNFHFSVTWDSQIFCFCFVFFFCPYKKKSVSEIEHPDIRKIRNTKLQLFCMFWRQRWRKKICRCVKWSKENSSKQSLWDTSFWDTIVSPQT